MYRILIKIRRYQGNNEGCTESPIELSDSNVFVRNTCRNLCIVYKDGDFAFSPQGELAFSNAIADETVIGSAVRGAGYSKLLAKVILGVFYVLIINVSQIPFSTFARSLVK